MRSQLQALHAIWSGFAFELAAYALSVCNRQRSGLHQKVAPHHTWEDEATDVDPVKAGVNRDEPFFLFRKTEPASATATGDPT